jgi:hypothetical protein
VEKIPCFIPQGIRSQVIEVPLERRLKIDYEGRFSPISLFFSLLAGKMPAETGPIRTASTTTQFFAIPVSWRVRNSL